MPKTLNTTAKNKYATHLVDQAVKSLCEIWCPQDIPTTQLPSPVSPLTQSSPPPPVSSASTCSRAGSTILQSDQDLASRFENRSNLILIKGFVHEP
ncbi:hypothetical protein DFH07DRAFT_999429 [Mycena maculata]|uniref:Uncharacterized protein n=1 Tax=Mycena maculata TaxID=230809 RepID=A0AAD7JSR5_9AGAR|nr:hypothetical protein DFH07DRAFT_999429 [Mycena maculata]